MNIQNENVIPSSARNLGVINERGYPSAVKAASG